MPLTDATGKPPDKKELQTALRKKLEDFQKRANNAKGKHRDSKEWKAFDKALRDCNILADALDRKYNGECEEIDADLNTEMLEYAYALAIENVKQTATAYWNYKTAALKLPKNANRENIKTVNRDHDRVKLEIVNQILTDQELSNQSLPGDGKPEYLPMLTKLFKTDTSRFTKLTKLEQQRFLDGIREEVAKATSLWKDSQEWKDLRATLEECQQLANQLPNTVKIEELENSRKQYLITYVKLQVMAERYAQFKLENTKQELSSKSRKKLNVVDMICQMNLKPQKKTCKDRVQPISAENINNNSKKNINF